MEGNICQPAAANGSPSKVSNSAMYYTIQRESVRHTFSFTLGEGEGAESKAIEPRE
jgi:hypothetical protein